ncbi:MAG: LacI family DNA-binding transcriptional regulator [Acidimicrobiia bacterium]|nr:LacI family DNA-binding transcriptional regulator [Acidimicrobiia bacterium]
MASTLEEIAVLSGVSRSTVSRVINDDPRVSEATREHVLRVVRREGYRPNLTARGLASGRTNVIAAVIPVGFENVLSDPYFPSLLHGMATAADAQDHFLMLSLGEPGFRHTVDEIARQGVVDGVVFSASQTDDPLLSPLIATGTPVVSVGRPDDARVSFVDVDNEGSARQITSHLLRLGHRRVALIAGPSFAPAARDRSHGFRSAVASHGLRVDENLVYEGLFSEASGRAGMRALLEHRPDAVFAASDRMAAGALNEIRAAGLRVPEDIALAGFDDMPLAREMEPPLTTVRQRPERLGEAAVNLLLDLMADPNATPKRVMLPTELIVRASCGSYLNQETLSRQERGHLQ